MSSRSAVGAVCRVVAAAVIVIGVGIVQLQGSPDAVGAEVTPLEITGSGTWSVNAFLTALANKMYDTPAPTALSYIPKGSRDGRRAFARGELDFVVTGRPFADDEKAQLAARKVSVIEAPFSVGAMAFLIAGPTPSGLATLTQVDPLADPNDPETLFNSKPYTGTLKMPNALLAKVFIERAGNNWLDPQFLKDNFGVPLPGEPANPSALRLAPVVNPLDPVVRSDPGTSNWVLERFIQHSAPVEWAAALKDGLVPAGTQSESWPLLATPSRGGTAAIAGLIGGWQSPRGSNTPQGGAIGPVSPADANAQVAAQPGKPLRDPPSLATPLFIPQIQNGAGEYVAPTTETISRAAEAGGGQEMYGLTENVPGAYPLTWINNIEVPASGLSPEVTTAVATLMRFAATSGQDAQRLFGEGVLPAPLAAKSLAAADQVVTGNCTGSDRKIETAGNGGPAWPNGVALPAAAGGSFKVCTRIGAPPVTTTTAVGVGAGPAGGVLPASLSSLIGSTPSASTYSPAASSSPVVDSSNLSATPVDASADTAAAAEAQQPAASAALAAVELPLKAPSDDRYHLDRLTTLLLGGLTFLLLRGPARRAMAGLR